MVRMRPARWTGERSRDWLQCRRRGDRPRASSPIRRFNRAFVAGPVRSVTCKRRPILRTVVVEICFYRFHPCCAGNFDDDRNRCFVVQASANGWRRRSLKGRNNDSPARIVGFRGGLVSLFIGVAISAGRAPERTGGPGALRRITQAASAPPVGQRRRCEIAACASFHRKHTLVQLLVVAHGRAFAIGLRGPSGWLNQVKLRMDRCNHDYGARIGSATSVFRVCFWAPPRGEPSELACRGR